MAEISGSGLQKLTSYNMHSDVIGLSPTPRKSERDRKSISYHKLNKGAPDSEEDDTSLKDQAVGMGTGVHQGIQGHTGLVKDN